MRKIVLIETQIISSGNFVNYLFIEFSSLCYSSNIEKQIFTPLKYKRNDNVSISNFISHRNFTREPNASVLVDDIRILMRYSVADGWQAAYVRDNSINLGSRLLEIQFEVPARCTRQDCYESGRVVAG